MDKNKIQTEWELNKNTIGVCKECTEDRKAEWQKQNKKLKIKEEDFVKVGVTDKKETEHLWFQVIAINKKCPSCKSKNVNISNLKPKAFTHKCKDCGDYFNEFIGRCDNTPVVIENIKYDGLLQFKFEDIEGYIKK